MLVQAAASLYMYRNYWNVIFCGNGKWASRKCRVCPEEVYKQVGTSITDIVDHAGDNFFRAQRRQEFNSSPWLLVLYRFKAMIRC